MLLLVSSGALLELMYAKHLRQVCVSFQLSAPRITFGTNDGRKSLRSLLHLLALSLRKVYLSP
jgi:hypothetical protein